MKRFLLLITILYPFCLFAQDDGYRPLIEEGKAWVSFNPINLQSTPPFWGYTQYDKIEGDTVVNGKPCKIWIQNYARRTDEYGQTSSAYPSTDRYNRVTSLDIINGRFNSSIYMVGGKRLGLRGRFFPSVTPINPWRRSINGKGYNTRLTPF